MNRPQMFLVPHRSALFQMACCLTLAACGDAPEDDALFRAASGSSVPSASLEQPASLSDSVPDEVGEASAPVEDTPAAEPQPPPDPAGDQPADESPVDEAADPEPEPEPGYDPPAPAPRPNPPADRDPPAALVEIVIERARYDADDEELEIRGFVSSEAVALVVEFLGRREALETESGEFDVRFEPVLDTPRTVTIRGDDGSTATAEVELED